MLYLIIIALLSVFHVMHAEVNPIPGENLWRLVSRIGECLDVTTSKVCVITSQLDVAISLSDELISSVDILASQVESLIDPLTSQLDSIADILCSKLMVIETEVESAIDLVSMLEPLFPSIGDLFESFLSTIDVRLSSATETVLSTIEAVEETLSDKIIALSDCLLGFTIHQSDIPYTITTPGVYTICEDLSLTSGTVPAIEIVTNNVTLNMNNHTILIGDAVNGISIHFPGSGNVINTIKVFDGTIQADNTLTVPCVQLHDAFQVNLEGIKTIGGANIHLLVGDNTADIILDQCQCLGNNGFLINAFSGAIDAAPTITSLSNLIIRDCVVENPFNYGIRLGDGVFGVYIVNTEILNIASNDTIGIYIQSNANNVVCEECVAVGGVGAINIIGYQVDNSSTTMRWCTAQQNSNSGYYIRLLSEASLFVECVAQGNNNGFTIFGNNAVLKRCSVTHNSNIGIYVDTLANNTQILDTCPVNNFIDFIDLGTNTVFINLGTVLEILCSKIETAQAVLLSAIEKLDIDIISVGDTVLSAIDTLEDVPCLVGTTIRQSDVNSSTYLITRPGVYTVCEDLSASFDLIHIQSDNVVLNLNSHTLDSASGRCVYSIGHSNIIIRNGSCTSFNEAVFIDTGSSNVSIENITIFNAAEPSIFCTQSENLIIRECVVNNWNGHPISNGIIAMNGCSAVTIENCTVSGINAAPLTGFAIIDPQLGGTTVSGCTVQLVQASGFMVSVVSSGSLNTCVLENCLAVDIDSVTPSAGYVIIDTVTGGTGCELRACTAEGTVIGFLVDSSFGTTLKNCIGRYNGIGYTLSNISGPFPINSVFLDACIAHTNSNDGFIITAIDTTARNCKAINNGADGFLIQNATNTVIEKSLASRNTLAGINNFTGVTTTLVDNRSSNGPTALNPAYQLNGGPDIFGTATIIILS